MAKDEKSNGLSRLHKWIVVFVGLGVIGASVAGTLYAIDKKIESKADAGIVSVVVQELKESKVDLKDFNNFVAFTKLEFVAQQRRRVQDRVWEIERNFGYDCSKMSRDTAAEYNRLKQQLRDIDRKISKIERGTGG